MSTSPFLAITLVPNWQHSQVDGQQGLVCDVTYSDVHTCPLKRRGMLTAFTFETAAARPKEKSLFCGLEDHPPDHGITMRHSSRALLQMCPG